MMFGAEVVFDDKLERLPSKNGLDEELDKMTCQISALQTKCQEQDKAIASLRRAMAVLEKGKANGYGGRIK